MTAGYVRGVVLALASRRTSLLPIVQHVITPGDHYSPRTGSAVVTVVHGLVREHQRAGGSSTVVVSRGTYDDHFAEGRVVEYDSVRGLPRRRERLHDAVLGAATRPRAATQAVWRPAVAAVERAGAALVHNGPSAGAILPADVQRVLYVHNTLLRSYTPWEARRVLGSFDHVVAVSRFLADEVERRAGRRTPVSVVPNGVDLEQFSPVPRREAGRPRVLFVGRVIPEKGAHLLVQAALRLRHLDFELEVAGSPGFTSALPLSLYEHQLRQAAAPLGTRVRFTPFVDRHHVPALMRRTDVVVVPSLVREGLGLVLLEAMATGAACVAAESGGLPEAAGDAAWLFPRGDVGALAGQLEILLTDPQTRSRVGAACRARAEEMTWSAAYQSLVGALFR